MGKSTVPVGTARQVMNRVRAIAPAGQRVDLAWNPEFLREGFAVQDSLTPDRIVLGVTSGRAEALLREVYAAPLAAGVPLLVMDLETAELVKVAANAFLATKISFINAMAEVCEEAGADVIPLAEALGYDARIGRRFLSPGLGFGGGCLPKDVRAFRATASALGVGSVVSLLTDVDAINEGRRERVVALARQAAGGILDGKRVAVLGVAFKPNSDDVRDSPSLAVCERLMAEGALVSVHDPVAMPNAARRRPELVYAGSVSEAAEGADLVLHLTEWSDYQAIDPAALARVVARRVIIDARCCLDAALWHEAGWTSTSPVLGPGYRGRPGPRGRSLGASPGRSSVVEVPDAGEVEADPRGLGGRDGQVVADRAARLGHRAHPGLGEDFEAIREGEIRVAGGHRACGPGPGPHHGQPGGVHPVDLAHADADRGSAGGEQDGVGFDRTAGLPGEGQIGQLRRIGRRTRFELPVRRIVTRLGDPVAGLEQDPPAYLPPFGQTPGGAEGPPGGGGMGGSGSARPPRANTAGGRSCSRTGCPAPRRRSRAR